MTHDQKMNRAEWMLTYRAIARGRLETAGLVLSQAAREIGRLQGVLDALPESVHLEHHKAYVLLGMERVLSGLITVTAALDMGS